VLTENIIPNLELTGGTLELGPAFQDGGAITNLTLDGTTLPAGNYQVNGTLIATNSTLEGTITIKAGGVLDTFAASLAATGSLTVQSGGSLDVASGFYVHGPITNAGMMNLTNATIYLYNNNTASYQGGIDNQGQINFYGASGDAVYAEYGNEYLTNQGTISQRPGTGNSSISTAVFSDPGTLDSQEGTLTLAIVSLQPSSVLNFGLNSSTDYGVIAVRTNVVLNGTVSVNFNNGFVPANNATFNVLTYPSFSGIFGSTNLPSGAAAQGVYGATGFSLVFGGSGTSTTQPILTIQRISASTVDVSWPTAAGNFNLQSSPNLTVGSWSNIVGGITTLGSNYVLTSAINGNAAFFRLESP
jgi:hypothetical protein